MGASYWNQLGPTSFPRDGRSPVSTVLGERNGRVERFNIETPKFHNGVNIIDKLGQQILGGYYRKVYTAEQNTARKAFAAQQFEAKFGEPPGGIKSTGGGSGANTKKSTAQSSASVDAKRRTSSPTPTRRASGGTGGASVTNLGAVTQKKTLLGE
jgi:hypothetical protein